MTPTKLIIVESSSKIETIRKYTENEFKIMASGGHVTEIEPKITSVYVLDKKYYTKWKVIDHANSFFKKIIDLKPTHILLATDPDREGERISLDIYDNLRPHLENTEFKRMRFNSITKESILQSLNNLTDIHQNLVKSAKARATIDFFLGFRLTDILRRKIALARSIGRIQAPALNIMAVNEHRINSSKPSFEFRVNITYNRLSFTYKNSDFRKLREDLKNLHNFEIKVENNKTRRSAPEPFNTASIQTFFGTRFKMSAMKLMGILQKLYSGENSIVAQEGLITYLRTDSKRIEKTFLHEWLKKLNENGIFNHYKINQNDDFNEFKIKKITDHDKNSVYDAHEAIRPTSDKLLDIQFNQSEDSKQEFLVYDIIFRNTLASVMNDSIYSNEKYTIFDNDKKIDSCTIYKNEYKGWEKVFPELRLRNKNIEPFKVRFFSTFNYDKKSVSEAKLISDLKKKGIGRPSTWQSIVPLLKNRNYIRLINNKIRVTNLGLLVDSFFKSYMPELVNESYTSSMERNLDDIIKDGNDHKVVCGLLDEIENICLSIKDIPLLDVVQAVKNQNLICCEKTVNLHYFKNKIDYSLYYKCQTCKRVLPYNWVHISNSLNNNLINKSYFINDSINNYKVAIDSENIEINSPLITSEFLKGINSKNSLERKNNKELSSTSKFSKFKRPGRRKKG